MVFRKQNPAQESCAAKCVLGACFVLVGVSSQVLTKFSRLWQVKLLRSANLLHTLCPGAGEAPGRGGAVRHGPGAHNARAGGPLLEEVRR